MCCNSDDPRPHADHTSQVAKSARDPDTTLLPSGCLRLEPRRRLLASLSALAQYVQPPAQSRLDRIAL